MIEPIIVITILVLLAWRIRRYIKKHRLNKSRDNQLLLDSPKSIKLGPFSGSYQYFKNPSLWWIISAANPQYIGSMYPPPGIQLRIPANISFIQNALNSEI